MVYTQKIQDAIHFSIKTHEVYQKQKRKGKDIPYITHPLTVGLILSQAGAEEELVIAGILHDTIEDSIEDKKVTKEMLAERFGENVATLVDSVTEKDRGLSWHERKEAALEEIKNFSHDSLLLKSADVISNNTELISDYKRDGDKTFERFNASKDEALQHTLQVIGVILNTWDKNSLAIDLSDIAYKLQDIGALGFMENSPATMIEYEDYSSDMDLICPVCVWKGTPKGNTEYYDQLLDVDCPRCGKKIVIVSYPLIKKIGL